MLDEYVVEVDQTDRGRVVGAVRAPPHAFTSVLIQRTAPDAGTADTPQL
jgi:hypothetical protein